jgi:hypothetical protein
MKSNLVWTCVWPFSAKRDHNPTTAKFWKWVSFVVWSSCRCGFEVMCNQMLLKSRHTSIFHWRRTYLAIHRFFKCAPRPSGVVTWCVLGVAASYRVGCCTGGDVGLLKAQFGATRAFLYTQCCYVIHSTSRLATSGDFFLSLLLFKKLDPNGLCGPHLKTRDVQKAVTAWLLFSWQPVV